MPAPPPPRCPSASFSASAPDLLCLPLTWGGVLPLLTITSFVLPPVSLGPGCLGREDPGEPPQMAAFLRCRGLWLDSLDLHMKIKSSRERERASERAQCRPQLMTDGDRTQTRLPEHPRCPLQLASLFPPKRMGPPRPTRFPHWISEGQDLIHHLFLACLGKFPVAKGIEVTCYFVSTVIQHSEKRKKERQEKRKKSVH